MGVASTVIGEETKFIYGRGGLFSLLYFPSGQAAPESKDLYCVVQAVPIAFF